MGEGKQEERREQEREGVSLGRRLVVGGKKEQMRRDIELRSSLLALKDGS